MAVYQISKIQIRRGKKDQLPQLASGEMGWAVDTQELFIGNGSVSEGAPMVGYTKILTNQDISASLIETLEYNYTPNANTGSLQGKLAETVSSTDFGTSGNGAANDSTSLQNAINQLFNNTTSPASGSGSDNVKARVTLRIPAGIYKIDSTLNIPSYATIIGAGIDKTIFVYTQTTAAFRSTPSVLTTDIFMSDLTIMASNNTSTDLVLLDLQSIDSEFTNLKLIGGRNTTDLSIASKGIQLAETSENLIFNNIQISNVCYGIFLENTKNVKFDTGIISSTGYGIKGNGTTGVLETQITNYKFNTITAHAIDIAKGTKTYVNNINLTHVGNDQDDIRAKFPQIYFADGGNVCTNVSSNRLTTTVLTDQYVPEIAGIGNFVSNPVKITLPSGNALTTVFRLPFNTDEMSTDVLPTSYNITYSVKTDTYFRNGTLSFAADPNSPIGISDDFTVAGDIDDAILLDFSAVLDHQSIAVKFQNTAATSSVRQLTYQYTAVFCQ